MLRSRGVVCRWLLHYPTLSRGSVRPAVSWSTCLVHDHRTFQHDATKFPSNGERHAECSSFAPLNVATTSLSSGRLRHHSLHTTGTSDFKRTDCSSGIGLPSWHHALHSMPVKSPHNPIHAVFCRQFSLSTSVSEKGIDCLTIFSGA